MFTSGLFLFIIGDLKPWILRHGVDGVCFVNSL